MAKAKKVKRAKLTDEQKKAYFKLRENYSSEVAFRIASRAETKRKWIDESGPTFKRTTFEHEGFTVQASLEYDEYCNSRLEDLGKFTDSREDGAIARFPDDEHPRRPMNVRNGKRRSRKFYDRHSLRFFVPNYPIAERRETLHGQGYSRGVADYLARKQAYEDAEKAEDVQTASLDVVIFKNGVELARNSLGGIETDPDDWSLDEYLDSYSILSDAIVEAKETLKGLCECPKKGKRSKVEA